ncbi:chromosomal replication initiator protein [Desulfovibrio litoralis DSM 11393]|uniref:Chromosomal replication initiator protein DnaA n=2 Tax=Desulfovibrio litoralis TaxID=466107 RepID=A0A1M7TJJ4_9BACT|nr:chromosomal replication initiator protein [Desulfovibrio litoralis DSM 11393]
MLKQQIKNILQPKYSESELNSLFNPLSINIEFNQSDKKLDNNSIKTIYVAFPHHFFSRWFFDKGILAFEQALSELNIDLKKVKYQIKNKEIKNTVINNKSNKNYFEQINQVNFKNNLISKLDFNFDDFFYNDKNFFPFSLACDISKGNKKQGYNPIIFYGNKGVGKTSLLIAMVNEFLKTVDKNKICFVNTEELNELYINSKNKITIRDYLKSNQVFILDEIQFLLDYPKLKKELNILLKLFKKQNTQILMASSQKINEMDWLGEDLFTFLCGGICLEIKEPDLDIRIKYIKNKIEKLNINLNSEQIISIAHKNHGFTLIDGILLKIKAYLELYDNQMKEKDFNNILNNTSSINLNSSSHIAIIEIVAKFFDYTTEEILSNKRTQNLVTARQIAMYICRKKLSLSYPKIGHVFNGKDHTTVMHAIKKIEYVIDSNKDMNKLVHNIMKKCNSNI